VRFWDTSALVPLLLEQPATAQVRRMLEVDPAIAAWWGTPVECASAAARLRREERLGAVDESRVLDLLGRLQDSWLEVLPSQEVRTQALRLLRVHSLKAANALQLAAARMWAGDDPGATFVTLDERLALAARLEGFRVLPEAG
jgi:predicted nucleic acid-binding protein